MYGIIKSNQEDEPCKEARPTSLEALEKTISSHLEEINDTHNKLKEIYYRLNPAIEKTEESDVVPDCKESNNKIEELENSIFRGSCKLREIMELIEMIGKII